MRTIFGAGLTVLLLVSLAIFPPFLSLRPVAHAATVETLVFPNEFGGRTEQISFTSQDEDYVDKGLAQAATTLDSSNQARRIERQYTPAAVAARGIVRSVLTFDGTQRLLTRETFYAAGTPQADGLARTVERYSGDRPTVVEAYPDETRTASKGVARTVYTLDARGGVRKAEHFFTPKGASNNGMSSVAQFFSTDRKLMRIEASYTAGKASDIGMDKAVVYYDNVRRPTRSERFATAQSASASGIGRIITFYDPSGNGIKVEQYNRSGRLLKVLRPAMSARQ